MRSSNLLRNRIEKLNFKIHYFNSKLSSKHLLIYGIKSFIDNYENFKDNEKENLSNKYQTTINEFNDIFNEFISKPINLPNKYIENLLDEFEFRFHRKASFFNLNKFRNLPFIRVFYSRNLLDYKFYVPYSFLDYIQLSNILFYKYCFNQNRRGYKDFNNGIKTKDNQLKEFFEWLKQILLELNIDKQIDYNNNNQFNNFDHFNQIKDSYKVVKKISESGIKVNIRKVKEYLNKKLSEFKDYQNNLPDTNSKLSLLFNSIENYLKNSSSDEFPQKFIEEDDELADEPADDNNDSKGAITFHGKEYDYKLIKSLFMTLVFASLNNENKIFGHFTTHGANTHRMTCKKFNLQGMHKIMRENIFLPSKTDGSKILYSADVSGQDIVVAISLAKKYFNSIGDMKKSQECDQVIKKIENITNVGVKIDSSTTVKGITNWLAYKCYEKVTEHLKEISFFSFNTFNSYNPTNDFKNKTHIFKLIVKNFIYTKLYGGSEKRIIKNAMSDFESFKASLNEVVNKNDSKKNHFNNFETNTFEALKRIQSIFNDIDSYNLKSIIKEIDNFLLAHSKLIDYLINNNLIADYSKKANSFEFFNKLLEDEFKICLLSIKFLDELNKIFKENFALINNFLNSAYKYYKKNKKTLPTLLNWQTVIIKNDKRKSILTRSKSYPVQASAAELMRQWLIELDKFSKKYDFTIINTIHDQVILDAPADKKQDIEEVLNKSIKKAAKKLRINPKLIRLDFKEY